MTHPHLAALGCYRPKYTREMQLFKRIGERCGENQPPKFGPGFNQSLHFDSKVMLWSLSTFLCAPTNRQVCWLNFCSVRSPGTTWEVIIRIPNTWATCEMFFFSRLIKGIFNWAAAPASPRRWPPPYPRPGTTTGWSRTPVPNGNPGCWLPVPFPIVGLMNGWPSRWPVDDHLFSHFWSQIKKLWKWMKYHIIYHEVSYYISYYDQKISWTMD